jgi:integrase
VQERLGHADILITLDTYAHLVPTIQRDAVKKLEKFYRSTEKTSSGS